MANSIRIRQGQAGHKLYICMKRNYHGVANPHWKGGQVINKGRVLIYKPDHPFCSPQKYVPRARLVAEEKVGRILLPGEDVHHINGDWSDDRPDNLEVLPHGEHLRRHMLGNRHGVGNKGWMNRKKTASQKLSMDQVAEIRHLYSRTERNSLALARRFGVARNTISQIVTGRTWKGVKATPAKKAISV